MIRLIIGVCVSAGAYFLFKMVPHSLMTVQNLMILVCVGIGFGAMGMMRK